METEDQQVEAGRAAPLEFFPHRVWSPDVQRLQALEDGPVADKAGLDEIGIKAELNPAPGVAWRLAKPALCHGLGLFPLPVKIGGKQPEAGGLHGKAFTAFRDAALAEDDALFSCTEGSNDAVPLLETRMFARH